MIHLLHTPTFEITALEAMGPLQPIGNATFFDLTNKGRGGKKSLRTRLASGSSGIAAALPNSTGGTVDAPLRVSFDVCFDDLPSTATRFVTFVQSGGSSNTAGSTVLSVDAAGGLNLSTQASAAVTNSGKKLAVNQVYTIDVEIVANTGATSYAKVWVDGELVLSISGTRIHTNNTGYAWVRFENHRAHATLGTHYSNIMIRSDAEGLGVPFGPLDFAYVPVTDATLGKVLTDDDGPFASFNDTVWQDFALAADARTGAVVAKTASIRGRSPNENPGLLDVRSDSTLIQAGASVQPAWGSTYFAPSKGVAPTTLGLRASPPPA